MSRITGVSILMTLAVGLLAAGSAQATCGTAHALSSLADGGGIVSNPEFVLPYGAPGCYTEGCYDRPPLGPTFDAVFWALGFGDPAVGAGADNGAFAADGWIVGSPPYLGPGGVYHYNRPLASDWAASAQIDGCVADAGTTAGVIDGNECTCVLLSDQWPVSVNSDEGFFALLGKRVDAGGDFLFDDPAQHGFRLQPVPAPFVEGTVALRSHVTVHVPPPPAGLYSPDGCDCGLQYKLYYQEIPAGSPAAPSDRSVDAGWIELTNTDGSPQQPFDPGQSVTLAYTCNVTDDWVFLAARVVGEAGFGAAHVSRNGTRIDCVACTDLDGDGYCAAPGTETPFDCDDGNPAIHPNAIELCNGVDDDCDLLTDEDRFAQEDVDLDGVAGLCDNCPALFNPLQDDLDFDSVGDACDNCPLERNGMQSDLDADGEGDLCDADDGVVYLRSAGADRVDWDLELGYGSWNLYRGDLAVLRTTGVYTQLPGSNPHAFRACDLADPWHLDGVPPTGTVFIYLVTGNVGIDESSLGADSSGTERPNTQPCP